ncbi:hypothetical protein [Agaribacter marinus]|uniref:Uncharacterized protein n=1 Tax=Agaribacter marinus TaxID=1431249 RepID=A0AA37SXS0_9ALTE|nr:hypothetical protein [Agaribacter marinus]GLR70119.1 hypothetical protein GCM10007852_10270 [Agaribacter marinus]
MANKKLVANAEKQKRFREKQKALGKKMVRGYISREAQEDYKLISEKTGWTDSEILSNSLRITYAAYKNGQIRFLNKWIQDDERKRRLKRSIPDTSSLGEDES